VADSSETLAKSVAQTLEDLCFHFAEPCDVSLRRDLAFARVAIDGHWSGELVLGVAPELLGQLTESILGEDALGADDAPLALLEIANVVCGNALPLVESTDAEFSLSAPAACGAERFDRATRPPLAEAFLDGGSVMVRLFRDSSSQ
jgi:hypothetical protein